MTIPTTARYASLPRPVAIARYIFSRMLDRLPYNEVTSYVLDPVLALIPESWQDQND